ncbi:MAG: cyclic nucleotide-binding domain-containing protein [Halothece sp. Uz-M2-17]|nr:cyclic nucleotide-binding domain-containing protein [Halothece sp. Uz-M2-17]
METKTFDTGEIIFREGDPSDYTYLIRKGKVEVIREHLGHTVQLNTLGPGELFGELGVIDDQPRSATVKVLEPVRLSVLSNEEVMEMIYENPSNSLMLLRSTYDRLRTMYTEKNKSQAGLETDLESFRDEMSGVIAQAIRDHEEGVMKSHVGILPIVAALLITVLVGGSIFFKAQILDFAQRIL